MIKKIKIRQQYDWGYGTMFLLGFLVGCAGLSFGQFITRSCGW